MSSLLLITETHGLNIINCQRGTEISQQMVEQQNLMHWSFLFSPDTKTTIHLFLSRPWVQLQSSQASQCSLTPCYSSSPSPSPWTSPSPSQKSEHKQHDRHHHFHQLCQKSKTSYQENGQHTKWLKPFLDVIGKQIQDSESHSFQKNIISSSSCQNKYVN